MPTLISAIAQPSFTGITAQASIASMKVSIGANRNSTLFAPVGTMVSLSSIFSASAKGCSKPNGPTTLGPRRICIAAKTLRSASVRKATMTSSGTSSASAFATVSAKIPMGEARNSLIALLRRQSLLRSINRSAFRHDIRCTADHIGAVIICDRQAERRGFHRHGSLRASHISAT